MWGLFKKRERKASKAAKVAAKPSTSSLFPPTRPSPPTFADTYIGRKQREEAVIKLSGLDRAFRSSKPIEDIDFLIGRDSLIDTARSYLRQEGVHVLLYGDRGVGKSSIGNVLLEIFSQTRPDEKIVVFRCNPYTELRDIAGRIFDECGLGDVRVLEHRDQTTNHVSGELGISAGFASGEVRAGNSVATSNTVLGDRAFADDPSWVAHKVYRVNGLLFIDELDKIANPEVKRKISTLVKTVSDYTGSRLNFVLAGIAQNAAELTDGHPSVQRCLKEIAVPRLTHDELVGIIDRGEKEIAIWRAETWLPLRFAPEAKDNIARLSHGYPYFTQLLAYHAAEMAIGEGMSAIDTVILEKAVSRAVNDAEDELKKSLDYALRDDAEAMFTKILIAAAETSADYISAKELRESVQSRFGDEVSVTLLNPYMKRLVGSKESLDEILADIENPKPIFIRQSSGNYKFLDPRMPSYIRLRLSSTGKVSSQVAQQPMESGPTTAGRMH